MPKAKTVVVDAGALEAILADAKDSDEARKAPGFPLLGLHEALAPIVPTLPEGWRADTGDEDEIRIRSKHCRAMVDECGVYAWEAGGDPVPVPHEAATYLLAHWAAKEST